MSLSRSDLRSPQVCCESASFPLVPCFISGFAPLASCGSYQYRVLTIPALTQQLDVDKGCQRRSAAIARVERFRVRRDVHLLRPGETVLAAASKDGTVVIYRCYRTEMVVARTAALGFLSGRPCVQQASCRQHQYRCPFASG